RLDQDFSSDQSRDLCCDWYALDVLRNVQVCLIKRQRLDDLRMLGEDGPDLSRDLLVDLEAWLHKDQVRALAPGSYRRHRRPNPERARLIARSRNDAALPGPANGDW